ncbi:Kif3b protein [Salpingoeca rosetta]|uniref:Kinesin-like protein n=1 Tax=Salpingoeca rosetta (strain ATCC 50818 / BSB-021) TaxID=946362 RepID=F2TWT1_SALR5|nr:Kif3b protein [Salpingoeca rosetta]EGD72527.1 Kif3b protein [Salpingoeca rosetta]|eukprot:XP_004999096.1 Kif3b protein [Salpingoeca rosetta]
MAKKSGASGGSKSADNVKVVIRCRPLSSTERKDGRQECVHVAEDRGTITVKNLQEPSKEPKTYTFDNVYGTKSQQEAIYTTSAQPIVDSVLEGFNGEHFACLFALLCLSTFWKQYLVRASYLEIYMEDIRDLLSKDQERKLPIRESPDTGVYVEDLTSIVVKSVKEIDKVMRVGWKNRKVGVTKMNAHSSRSHAIFMVNVECSEAGEDGEAHIRSGKLNLVDLAGSERQGKTMAEGERAKEGSHINKSLSALGQVIKALVDSKGSGFVPYRNSSLTRLLQDSLGGNAKTMMIAAIGPADYNYNETISTLGYAHRAKSIKNKPKINEDPKDALLRKYQEEIAALKHQLESKGSGGKKRKGGKKKKKKVKTIRYDADGQPIEEEEEEEDEEEEEGGAYNEEEARRLREQAFQKLEEEKQRMLQDQTILQEEKDRLRREMEEKQQQMQREEQAAAELSAKIAALESRLLVGGKDINEYTAEQEARLRRERKRVEEEKKKAERLQQQLDRHETQRMLAEDKFSSLRDAVRAKTEKLEKLFHKYETVKQELGELDEMFYEQRDTIMHESEETRKQLRLKELIIEHFMPPEEAAKFRKRAVFDEELQEYRLLSATHTEGADSAGVVARPVSAYPNRNRPITLFSQVQSGIDKNPRYRSENVMTLELDLPERTTQDYTGPAVDARVQEVLNDALHDDDELVMEEPVGDFIGEGIKSAQREMRRRKAASGRPKRPGTAKGTKKKKKGRGAPSDELFPTTRGLVSK